MSAPPPQFPSPEWDSVTGAVKDLIKDMLTLDQNKRVSADKVLVHPWITVGWECGIPFRTKLSK